MASSLAAQLAQGASLNATLLADRSRRKPIESYLFTGREANQHDLESIHALASNGLIQLRALDKRFGTFGNSLFSDASKTLDRTLQNKEANARLNEEIEQFMGLLSPFLMEAPAGKVMEWLVRRFRCVSCSISLPSYPHFCLESTSLTSTHSLRHSFLIMKRRTLLRCLASFTSCKLYPPFRFCQADASKGRNQPTHTFYRQSRPLSQSREKRS